MHAQRSSPVELALRARREDPKRLLLEPLRGQRVLLGTWLETSGWEGPSLSHFQSPSRENQNQTEHPLARLCGEEFATQLASIRQMSRQLSRGSAGEYQADERAGVARLS